MIALLAGELAIITALQGVTLAVALRSGRDVRRLVLGIETLLRPMLKRRVGFQFRRGPGPPAQCPCDR